MNRVIGHWPRILILIIATSLAGCGQQAAHDDAHAEHGDHHESHGRDEPARGPHGGRLLQKGDVRVELAIFEQGVAPEFHAWVTQAGKPASEAQLQVNLTRLGGAVSHFDFVPQADYLKSSASVEEPHSFIVTVTLALAGTPYEWRYDSLEGRVHIDTDMAADAGITTQAAGPATLHDVIALTGRIVPNAEAVHAVAARFPGTIRSVAVSLGDDVRAGQTLARIESNDSLQVYALTAPIAGVITERRANVGEQAGDAPLFTVSRFDTVWAELSVFPRDLARIAAGQTVRVRGVDSVAAGEGRIARIAPAGKEAVLSIRVPLDNREHRWTPGLFVSADVEIGSVPVPLAVRQSALQRFREFDVVFERVGNDYEVRMLELGRRDGEWVEVLSGLAPGAQYVSGNSYLIKADIEKSGASHDH